MTDVNCRHLDQVKVTELPERSTAARKEEWSYCYIDEIVLFLPQVRGRTAIPPAPVVG